MLLGGLAAATALLVYIDRHGSERHQSDSRPREVPMADLPAAAPRESGTMRIGWTAWRDAEVLTAMTSRLLERHFGLEVQRVMADIGIQYQGVARGDLDAMMMAWLPTTHRSYWQRVGHRVVDLGPVYGGRLGWVVPAYVPDDILGSIADLRRREVAQRVDFRVQGIDPGSGLMQASERALDEYDLAASIRLVPASAAAMTAVLDRAIRRRAWVVVTGWEPHWMFARHDLRFLDDPEGVMGGPEQVHVIVRDGFERDFAPEVVSFFARLHLPGEDVAHLLLRSQEVGVGQAVDDYLQSHPRRVRYWLTGQTDGD